jgi:hypothetical protein
MKLIFFLIAFSLVSIRAYFSWSGKDRQKRGLSQSNMVIKSDNFYEQINYTGKFELSDDESSFKSISPGGYFKFRKNDIRIEAESNLRGEIVYTIYDGKNILSMDEQGKLLVAQAIKEMIERGYDANERMERVYRKGGPVALLNEVDSMKADQVKVLYLARLFAIDSLLPSFLPYTIKKIASLGSDQDKVNFLTKITAVQLENPQTDSLYFDVIKGIGSDMDRMNAIWHIINRDSIANANTDKILFLAGRLASDMDKANVFQKMIDKGLIAGQDYDGLLTLISKMSSDMDKANLYKKLISQKDLNEGQWIILQDKISQLGSDNDKTNLLVELAPKMPQTAALKINYQKAAKTLRNDYDYGHAMRAIQ